MINLVAPEARPDHAPALPPAGVSRYAQVGEDARRPGRCQLFIARRVSARGRRRGSGAPLALVTSLARG
jgi:hypothetical protein